MPDSYLMEDDNEAIRLDIKTDPHAVETHARWAGLSEGMRVADMGCGAGITTSVLARIVTHTGKATGIDFADNRIEYAKTHYSAENIEFVNADVRQDLSALGEFDFIWVRFVLEYYLSSSISIVSNITKALKPGGTICLVDLDHNCLGHYGLSDRLERTVGRIMRLLEQKVDFDPYAGRKLYSYLYDLGFKNIEMKLDAHHLIYGPLAESDAYNWVKKVEVLPRFDDSLFNEYKDGYKGFRNEFEEFFNDERRFTYTPVILCKGQKPIA